jgi:hypothetical protein
MAFTHTKKVAIGSFIKARIRSQTSASGSGSDQKDPDPTVSGSATLLKCIYYLSLFYENFVFFLEQVYITITLEPVYSLSSPAVPCSVFILFSFFQRKSVGKVVDYL